MEKKEKNVNTVISAYETVLKILEKYKIKDLIKGLLFLIVMYGMMIGYTLVQNEQFVDTFITETNKRHQDALKERQTIQPYVKSSLNGLLAETKADRAFVLEMHNGSNNPSGLAFQYAEMTYEEVSSKDIQLVADEYTKILLAKYQLPTYLFNNYFFYGTIDELDSIDSRFANMARYHGTQYLAICIIQGKNTEIGAVGISFTNCKEIMKIDKGKLNKIMIQHAQELSTLLDYEAKIENKQIK